MPHLIRDVTTHLMCALNDISNTRADCNQDDGETTHYVERHFSNIDNKYARKHVIELHSNV